MKKAADAANMSVLFFSSAGANFQESHTYNNAGTGASNITNDVITHKINTTARHY